MKREWFTRLLFIGLFLAGSARAEWAVTSSKTERSAQTGVEHRRVVVTEKTGGGSEATIDLALFSSKSATIRVIDNPQGEEDLSAIARREKAIAGVNGGYFDPEDKPVGLMIADGQLIAPLRKARLLSGLLFVSDGRIQLLRVAEYSSKRKAVAALQCGPFLVDHSAPVAGLNATKSARRTFLAQNGSDRFAIGSCSDATLAELANIMTAATLEPGFKIQRALNLDGGSSSAFWFAGERGPISISELKTVRNFVVVVPR